ncbi:Scd6-like Sm domain-containing protein [Collybia nuda]|uniref:Scd6-like Sm domain-containing protein n=1 Tax=Collybia nuda TaxID=64659 RepID=A0A9P5Y1S5_9AGAR|nr:Scd6-like Sm domain-containing protein [Collybia nuda]
MALSFIGKPISLISHSDVRYRGILAGIDPAASTIQLSNVYSMGTESRRPPTEFIPPVQEPYQYIIFRASEVKDLAVDEPTPLRSVHDDPAVLGASAPTANPAYSPYPAPATVIPPAQQPQQPVPPPQPVQPPPTQADTAVPARPQPQARRSNPVHTAAASLETVERAIGDLRVSNHTNAANGRGGRRGGRGGGARDNVQIKVPATDFDFESSNAKFDKAALTPRSTSAAGKENGEEESGEAAGAEEKEKEKETAYNPQKSFFDSLSSSSHGPPASGAGAGGAHAGNGRGRRGGRGMGRNRREEEREKNVSTFGEPGGVGLMGPGAYVGGWGGYGRRGGRPRRGGPQGGGGGPAPQTVQAQV